MMHRVPLGISIEFMYILNIYRLSLAHIATEILKIQSQITARRAIYHYDRCQVEVQ